MENFDNLTSIKCQIRQTFPPSEFCAIRYACSGCTIKNNNGSDVCSPADSLRGISKNYSVSHSLYYLCTYPTWSIIVDLMLKWFESAVMPSLIVHKVYPVLQFLQSVLSIHSTSKVTNSTKLTTLQWTEVLPVDPAFQFKKDIYSGSFLYWHRGCWSVLTRF